LSHVYRKRSELQYFVDEGLLDFAVFDCNKDTTIDLLEAKSTIGAGQGASAVILIANYIFDSLVSDTFRVVKGRLEEGLITLESKHEEENPEQVTPLTCSFDLGVALTVRTPLYTGPFFDRARYNILGLPSATEDTTWEDFKILQ